MSGYPELLLGPPRLLPVLLLWVSGMIAVPLLSRRGEKGRTGGIMLGVILQAVLVTTYLFYAWDFLRVLVVLLLVPALGWLAEFAGSRTGIPFGRYHYTKALQPQIGEVPVAIPLAWLMMLPPSWAVADLILPGGSWWLRATIGAASFTAWDIYLDPHLVSWSFWKWEKPGRYYMGIPLGNFLGWFLWAWIITALVTAGMGPYALSGTPLFLVYFLTWLFQFGGHMVFWKLGLSGIVGFVAMGIPAGFALRALVRMF
ncbi:MAG: carotenoid biosynthesis protein [Spirochaetaceae bacterium]|nr:MAG: carotenoid biosynthesis protein [Spirochaetaceae bacterium]